MLYTSAEAAKLLRKLNDDKQALEQNERQTFEFSAAINENIEQARPEYDYEKTRAELEEIELKIRKVKHAINKFNLEHEVPGFNMTIDQLLVYLPQLQHKKMKLYGMKGRLAKTREPVRVAGTIEYTYANYDVAEVKKDYDKISAELSRAQLALDALNTQIKFEIDL
ncbi:MAG: hypothetical protein IJR94_05225 [Synergistaceae bacterium]|nr:hypothetical protein [Synergistaceae bacterium]